MGFNEIKGQERAIKILRQAIAGKYIAQTYLFHGPEGVGKKKTALTFAKTLNCTDSEIDACGLCLSCRKIGEEIHPDVIIMRPDKGEIKIGTVRDVISGMAYRPLEGRKRVVIVDDADMCNISASNAFLKTLEEPPPETIIILVSSSPDTLPQTVLSRCHRVSFGNIPVGIITDALEEEKGLTRALAEQTASLAEGSIGRAFALSSDEVKQIRKEALKWVTEGGKDVSSLFDMTERLAKDMEVFYDSLYWIYAYFRDILILKCKGEEMLLINKDLYERLSGIKDGMTVERLLDIIGFIQFIYKGQERNMNRQLALDVLCTKINEYARINQ